MTEQRPIPKPMVAALSGALDEWFGAKTLDVWPDWDEGATEAATALLNSATVREEWGVRLTWPDGHYEDTWLDERKYAQLRYDLHRQKGAENPGWRVTPTLIRRSILTLPAEVVESVEQR